MIQRLYLLVFHKTSQMSKKIVHPAALVISVKESPLQLAKNVSAERVECALKVVALMPDFSRISTTQ